MNPNKKIFKNNEKLLKLAKDNYIIFFRGVYSRGGYIPHAFHQRWVFIWLNIEFFAKRIKAQADLQFVKIFGD